MDAPRERLARSLGVLANETRLALVDRLARPAFAPELEEELGLTRQALKKHLDILVEEGLVEARAARRGVFPATQYATSPQGLFGFQEDVLGLAAPPRSSARHSTRLAQRARNAEPAPRGPALLVVHGARRGEWIPLPTSAPATIGRDASNEIALKWDPFASARHAVLHLRGDGWRLTDLRGKNGTWVDFEPMAPGGTMAVASGVLLGIGHSLLLLRA